MLKESLLCSAMIYKPNQEAKYKHINKKLAIFFLLLYFIVPAALIVPLYERVEEVERKEQVNELQGDDTSVKKVCDKSAKKPATTQKTTCNS